MALVSRRWLLMVGGACSVAACSPVPIIPLGDSRRSAPPPAPFSGPPVSQVVPEPVTISLVDMRDGTFCPPSLASERTKLWGSVGTHSYTGTVDDALFHEKFGFTEVPKLVRDMWLAQVHGLRGINGFMKIGDRVCSMVWTSKNGHTRWNNVVANWKDKVGNKPRTELVVQKFVVTYGGFDWVLGIPPKKTHGCDNWFYVVVLAGRGIKTFTRDAPRPPVPRQPVPARAPAAQTAPRQAPVPPARQDCPVLAPGVAPPRGCG